MGETAKESDGTALEAYYTRGYAVFCVVVALAFIAAGYWMLGVDPSDAPQYTQRRYGWLLPWFGWVVIAFSVLAAVPWARAIFDRRAALRIGRKGVVWRRRGDTEVPWSEIIEMGVRSMRGTQFISLRLEDPSRFPPRRLSAPLVWMNKAMGYGDLTIWTTGLDRSFEDVLDAIRRFSGRRV